MANPPTTCYVCMAGCGEISVSPNGHYCWIMEGDHKWELQNLVPAQKPSSSDVRPCPHCRGSGQRLLGYDSCQFCGGTGKEAHRTTEATSGLVDAARAVVAHHFHSGLRGEEGARRINALSAAIATCPDYPSQVFEGAYRVALSGEQAVVTEEGKPDVIMRRADHPAECPETADTEREAITLHMIEHREWAREKGRMPENEARLVEQTLNVMIQFCEIRRKSVPTGILPTEAPVRTWLRWVPPTSTCQGLFRHWADPDSTQEMAATDPYCQPVEYIRADMADKK